MGITAIPIPRIMVTVSGKLALSTHNSRSSSTEREEALHPSDKQMLIRASTALHAQACWAKLLYMSMAAKKWCSFSLESRSAAALHICGSAVVALQRSIMVDSERTSPALLVQGSRQ